MANSITKNFFFFSLKLHFLDMCIMPTKLAGNADCPRDNSNNLAEKCVAKYISAESCKAAGGKWTKFISNYAEKTAGVLSTCHGEGDMKLARGLPYEPHMLSQGADQSEQFVLLHKPPDVIYAPSTVVNHNGMNMEGKFSSYKWKVPCFPTNTTQRCLLRLRWVKLLEFFAWRGNITTANCISLDRFSDGPRSLALRTKWNKYHNLVQLPFLQMVIGRSARMWNFRIMDKFLFYFEILHWRD